MPRLPSREDVQTLLAALLTSRKEAFTAGVPMAQLDQDYRDQEGTRIPFRQLGYVSLLDFLQSLTGGLYGKFKNGTYYLYPLVTEKSRHVSRLVAGQNCKKPSHKRMNRQNPFHPRLAPPQATKLDSATMAEIVKLVRNNPQGVLKSQILEYVRRLLNQHFDAYDLGRQLREINHEIVIEGEKVYPIARYQQRENQDTRTESKWPRSSPPVSTGANGHFSDAKPAGFSDSEMEERYDDKLTPVVPDTRYDKSRKRDEDILRCKAETVNENESFPHVETERETWHEEDESIAILISERTRIRLQKLIGKHPEGIWCADLPSLYQQEYTIPLNYEELGFSSVIDYAAYLPEIFHYARPQDKGDFKLFNARATKPNIKPGDRRKVPSLASLHNIYEQYVEPTEPIPSILCQTTIDKLIPDGVMTAGETVAQICVTELDRGADEYISVSVSDVFTPSFFWIQLLKRIPKFTVFMNELHEFYATHAKKYSLPLAVMEKGINCACMYDGKWHRGIVKEIRFDGYITVMFYDYGTIKSYPLDCIHFLHRSFSNLPAQAIPCGLHNVKPTTGTHWSRTVACEFVAKVTNVSLIATIVSIDTANNSMLVGLTNTEGAEDFHISDWMVQSGLAIYGNMVRIRPPNYPFRRFLERNISGSSNSAASSNSKGDANTLNLARNSDETVVAESCEPLNTKNYDNSLKLYRESGTAKDCPVLSVRENPGRDNSFANDVESRKIERDERKIITHEVTMTGETDGPLHTAEKLTRPRLRREVFMRRLCKTSAIVRVDSDSKERTDRAQVASADPLSLVDDACRNATSDTKLKSELKGMFKRASIETDATEVADERVDREIKSNPLHLRNGTRIDDSCTEFGTFRSRFGGCGRMELMNWSEVRATLNPDQAPASLVMKQLDSSIVVVSEEESIPAFPKRSDASDAARRSEIPMRTVASRSRSSETPTKLLKVSDAFARSVQVTVEMNRENPDLECALEGNIQYGSDLKPWQRAMTSKLNGERAGSTKIFIPSDLLALMRNAANHNPTNKSESYKNNGEEATIDETSCESLAKTSAHSSNEIVESHVPIDPPRSNIDHRKNSQRSSDEPSNSCDISSPSSHDDLSHKAFGETSNTTENLPEVSGLPIGNEENSSIRDKIRVHNSTREINTWLKTVRIRPRNQRLFDLVASRFATSNNTESDSEKECMREKNEVSVSGNSPNNSTSRVHQRVVDGTERDAEQGTRKDYDCPKPKETIGNDSSTSDSLPSKDTGSCVRQNEKIAHAEDHYGSSDRARLEDDSIPKNLAIDEKIPCARSLQDDPIFDDLDLPSDDGTWDYSPGWCVPEVFGIREPTSDDNDVPIAKNSVNLKTQTNPKNFGDLGETRREMMDQEIEPNFNGPSRCAIENGTRDADNRDSSVDKNVGKCVSSKDSLSEPRPHN